MLRDAGSQTREILQGKVKEGREYIRKEANDFRDRASELVEKGSDVPKAQVGSGWRGIPSGFSKESGIEI